MANKYPVEWNGQAYTMGDLTVGVKNAYCAWLRHKLSAEGITNIAGRADVLNAYLASIPSLVWWGDGGCSVAVHESLRSPDGGLFINRLLFGESGKVLSDADLRALIDEKDTEQKRADTKAKADGYEPPYPPANDYGLAMKAIREVANPKA